MLDELATYVVIIVIGLLIYYYITKWAVKNGIIEAYKEITGKQTAEEIEENRLIEKYNKEVLEKEKIKRSKNEN